MTDPAEAPPGLDLSTPSVARSYDYLLGGKDNYPVDHQVTEMLFQVAPEAQLTARANREFGARAARCIAERGIRQFIDLGSGIPTSPPAVHEVVRAVDPAVRVVYVDHDPVVVAHSRALRSIGPGLTTVLADIRRPDAILDHQDVLDIIDWDEWVGVLIFSVLDLIEDPFEIVGQLRERMAPGSFLGISHLSARSDQDAIDHAHKISEETGFPRVEFRDDEAVLDLFTGFELVEPGLVNISDWRPVRDAPSTKIKLVGAVGRKTD
ncbi:MAG: SAM-dependent methyltransferase [Pseudonocardiaceae bacterium]